MKSLKSIESICCLVLSLVANLASHPRNRLPKIIWVSNFLSNRYALVLFFVTLEICKQLIESNWSPKFLSNSFNLEIPVKFCVDQNNHHKKVFEHYKFYVGFWISSFAILWNRCDNSVELIQRIFDNFYTVRAYLWCLSQQFI